MSLAYDRAGEGPGLVLLHPLGADRRIWDPVLALLTPHRDVLAVDLPGFGASSPLRGDASPRALAAAVAGWVEGLGLERPHVAGNSLGGWVALELGLSGIARSVTAIAPAGLWPEPLTPKRGTARRLARMALPLIDPLVASASGRRLLLAGSVARPEQVPPPAAAHLVRSYASAPGFPAVNDAMRAGCFVGLERIRGPVTLAWPERDRLVAHPRWLPDNTRSRTLAGCGHIPMWDDPDQVARLLLTGTA